MKRPSYQECLDAGMNATQTAKARGVTRQAASAWASKQRKKGRDVAFLKMTPEEQARKAGSSRRHLLGMTPEQRSLYDLYRKKRFSKAEALKALGVDFEMPLEEIEKGERIKRVNRRLRGEHEPTCDTSNPLQIRRVLGRNVGRLLSGVSLK